MVCKDLSLDIHLSTSYRKEQETLDGRGLSWSFTTILELVDLAFRSDFHMGSCSGLRQISLLSGLQDLSCQTFTPLKIQLLNCGKIPSCFVFTETTNTT